MGTIETVGVVCERPMEAAGAVREQSHCCYWGELEDYLICCRLKEGKEIPLGVNKKKHLSLAPPERSSVLSVALSGQDPHPGQAHI